MNFKAIMAIDKLVSALSAIYRNSTTTRTYVDLANRSRTQDEHQFYLSLARNGADELTAALRDLGVDPKKGTIDEKVLTGVVEPIVPLFLGDNPAKEGEDTNSIVQKLTSVLSKVMARATGSSNTNDEQDLIREVVSIVSSDMGGDVPVQDVTEFIQRKLAGFKRVDIQRYKGVH